MRYNHQVDDKFFIAENTVSLCMVVHLCGSDVETHSGQDGRQDGILCTNFGCARNRRETFVAWRRWGALKSV